MIKPVKRENCLLMMTKMMMTKKNTDDDESVVKKISLICKRRLRIMLTLFSANLPSFKVKKRKQRRCF